MRVDGARSFAWSGVELVLARRTGPGREAAEAIVRARTGQAIVRQASGAPMVPGWGCSISYSGAWVAVALAPQPVGLGIDLEAELPFPVAEVPWHLMNAGEAEAVRAAAEFWPAFFRLWTRKEALAKLEGLGAAADWPRLDTEAPGVETRRIALDGQGFALSLALAKGR